jgi:hypothetical protein
MHAHAAGDRVPEHLDVLEQPRRHEPRLDDLGHLGSPVVADVDVRDQLYRIGRRLSVVLDDDLLDLVRMCAHRKRCDDREREDNPTHVRSIC